MTPETEQTIVAIASPTSPAARGIVRLSGEQTADVLKSMGAISPAGTPAGGPTPSGPTLSGRRATRHETDLSLAPPLGRIPVSLLQWPTSRSYTGQPSAEVHTFGSLPILTAIVDAAVAAGARAARPGEFTMRAFLAGRLDLTQAEAVLGVIEAEGRGSLDHALRQLAGNLATPLEAMRSTMLDMLADVEAGLDFVDEDIEFVSDTTLLSRLSSLAEMLSATRQQIAARDQVSGRATVALRGEPNAGKSQLINRLSGSDASIVADVAGTTRDVVIIDTAIGGREVRLVDTAGIETPAPQGGDNISHGNDLIAQAQEQAQRASEQADVRLWCVDSTRGDFAHAAQRLREAARRDCRSAVDLWVATKQDLCDTSIPKPWLLTSSVSGAGIDLLRKQIRVALESRDAEEIGSVVGTAARCKETLRRASDAITAAIELANLHEGHEFIATELRTAVQCLGEVTGAVYTDDILDRVFGRFCIGK